MQPDPKTTKRVSTRHPHTYAADFLRGVVQQETGHLMSRAESSRVRQKIAEALFMYDDWMASRLSEAYQRKENISDR